MSSGCGDVISLEDMKTIKLHQTFEAEVITGHAGGVASGSLIDLATNPITAQAQKTLPAVLRDLGFDRASFDFTTGGILTITDRDKVVFNPADNNWYSWSGILPHTVSAGTDPLLDTNWIPRTDNLLREDLAADDGAKWISLPFITPEIEGSTLGVITPTQALQNAIDKAIASPSKVVYIGGDLTIVGNINVTGRVHIIIDGVLKQVSGGSFTWTEANRRSPYSMFNVTGPGISFSGSGRIENEFEAVSVDSGADDFVFEGITISNPSRSKSVGLSIYNVKNCTVRNCTIANNGSKGTYVDSSSSGITGRYGNGIDFGSINGMSVSGVTMVDNGSNGAWCYGVSDFRFVNNWAVTNGTSGMQYGPHPSYDGVLITNNIMRKNTADGIDINYTGASPVSIKGTISNNTCVLNGFYNADTTKPTSDGSGVTVRNVIDYKVLNNVLMNNNGVGVYATYAAKVEIASNLIVNGLTSSSGIFQGFSSTDVNIHDNIISTMGTCYQEGGSMPITRMKFMDNIMISTNAQTVSIPSNTQTDRKWSGNHHTTPNPINFWFGVHDEQIRYTGSTGRALYINTSFGRFRDINVTGASSGDLVYIDGGVQNKFSGLTINNTGSGRGVYSNASSYVKISDSFIQCAAGVATHFEAGNEVRIDDCNIVGTTAISAPVPGTGSAPTIYFSGRNQISGTVSTAVATKSVQFV